MPAWLAGGWQVAETVECLLDVPWHGDIDCYVIIIPCQVQATIDFRIPVYGDCVMCFQGLEKMFGVIGIGVFYSKIVDDEAEGDGSRCMAP
jgi:hypothetical protein